MTGATGGIGAAVCRRLAALGCSIGIHYNTDQDAALALLEEFKEEYMHAFGSKFVCYGADLGNYEEVGNHARAVDCCYKWRGMADRS